jgi:hypothetical protein
MIQDGWDVAIGHGNGPQVGFLLITTAVDHVSLDFGSPDERRIDRMTLSEARKYLAEGVHFAEGSMAPQIRAVIGFLERGGDEAIITDPRAWSGRSPARPAPTCRPTEPVRSDSEGRPSRSPGRLELLGDSQVVELHHRTVDRWWSGLPPDPRGAYVVPTPCIGARTDARDGPPRAA